MKLQFINLYRGIKDTPDKVQNNSSVLDPSDRDVYTSGWLQRLVSGKVKNTKQPFMFSYMGTKKMENSLFTDDPDVAINWLESPTPTQLNRISRYFTKGNKYPLIKLYVTKGTPVFSIPRISVVQDASDNTIHINTFGNLIQSLNYFIGLKKFYKVSYFKNDASLRVMYTSPSKDLVKQYYEHYAVISPLTRTEEDSDTQNRYFSEYHSPKSVLERLGIPLETSVSLSTLAKGYTQCYDLELSTSQDALRVVHVNDIVSMEEVSPKSINKSLLNLNFLAVINAVDNAYGNDTIPSSIPESLIQQLPPSNYNTYTSVVAAVLNQGDTKSVNFILEDIKKNRPMVDLKSCEYVKPSEIDVPNNLF
jgi:hypothetical protein